mmetsp:Transcript_8239/g.10840  ORF Transcript_8239/g.10840 Transcript_8239/m.10840 type:complete len:343 (-) Transcript_8239:524-1552(-)
MFFPFGIVLALHAPADVAFVAYVLSFVIILYFLDSAFVWLFMTEHVKDTKFTVLDCGLQITMPLSTNFNTRSDKGGGGFVFVCVPWVSETEWHPFSIYDDPKDEAKRNIFIYKTGDWSKKLYHSLERDTTRPVWLQGPFQSPFGSSIEFDHQILVATGIGITPAICTIDALKAVKTVNLIWMTHDPDLVEFYLSQHVLDQQSFNIIFYTGERKLDAKIVAEAKNVNVVCGFANIDKLLPQIICNVEVSKRTAKKTSSRQIKVVPVLDEECKIAPAADVQEGIGMPGFNVAEDDALAYVADMSKEAMNTWGILYCGMCPPVYRGLKRVSKKYGIRFHVEGFKW